MFVNSTEDPAMTMEVAELCVFKVAVELGRAGLLEKLHIRPEPPNGSPFRVSGLNLALLGGTRMTLLRWPHAAAIDLVVPPGVSEVGRLHVGTRMDMTRDALAGWNRARKFVPNRMARFLVRDGRIARGALPNIACRSVCAGMLW